MLHVVLYQPEIPPNTGNIIRLCANAGAALHLIHPLGFNLDEKKVRRAGLDYHDLAKISHYDDAADFAAKNTHRTIYACTTKTNTPYTSMSFKDDDMLLFGPETRGLPEALREQFDTILIPMCANNRSLNLSNSVAIILFEAWRQLDFVNAL